MNQPNLTVEEVSAKWAAHTENVAQIESEIDALAARLAAAIKAFTAECAPLKVGALVEVAVNGKIAECQVKAISPEFSAMNFLLPVGSAPELPAWNLSLIVLGKNGRPNARYTGPITKTLQPTQDGGYLALTGKPKKGAARG